MESPARSRRTRGGRGSARAGRCRPRRSRDDRRRSGSPGSGSRSRARPPRARRVRPARAVGRRGAAMRGSRASPFRAQGSRGGSAPAPLRAYASAMRAITVIPGQAGSARLDEVPEPAEEEGAVLVDAIALGICGTDGEIAGGEYGWAPAGEERLVLGHESLGRVRECPDDAGLSPGDLVVGIVRRPDPIPCACCAAGDWDFCRNGDYTERGIKERHGYGSERWRVEPEFAVRIDADLVDVGVLLEPTSVVAKAWEQIERIGGRACFDARRVLVTGAGPIGLLAALLAAQRGYEVHVLDQVTEGPKPDLVARLGGTYHHGAVADVGEVDIVIEATGVGKLVVDAIGATARNGIVCLTG